MSGRSKELTETFKGDTFTIRSKFPVFWNEQYRILNGDGSAIAFVRKKDRIYHAFTEESCSRRLFSITHVLPRDSQTLVSSLPRPGGMLGSLINTSGSAFFGIVSADSQETLCTIRVRRGKGLPNWSILNPDGEDQITFTNRSVLRKLLTGYDYKRAFVLQKFSFRIGEREVGVFKECFCPFGQKFRLDLSFDKLQEVDRTCAVALGLLVALELSEQVFF